MDPAGDAGQRQRHIKVRVAEESLAVGKYINRVTCREAENTVKPISSQVNCTPCLSSYEKQSFISFGRTSS